MTNRGDSVVPLQRVISVRIDSRGGTLADVHPVHQIPDNHQVSRDRTRELQVSWWGEGGGEQGKGSSQKREAPEKGRFFKSIVSPLLYSPVTRLNTLIYSSLSNHPSCSVPFRSVPFRSVSSPRTYRAHRCRCRSGPAGPCRSRWSVLRE